MHRVHTYIHRSSDEVQDDDSLTVSATSRVENQHVLVSGYRLLLAGEFDSRHLGRADLSSPLSDLTVIYGAILNPNYTRILRIIPHFTRRTEYFSLVKLEVTSRGDGWHGMDALIHWAKSHQDGATSQHNKQNKRNRRAAESILQL